jgi:hypothetical protein
VRRPGWRALVATVAVALIGVTATAGPVAADSAGPTDYLTEITSVTPPTATIETAILGGDSFFQLTVRPGTEVIVIGYQGEDNLWFRPDGTVLENQNSPSTYLNRDRLGGVGLPPNATADAAADWVEVARGGSFAWHDHRAHWMQTARPFGLGPGDQILESVIPLLVDGEEVRVTVISTWQPSPSPLPAVAGFALGVALAVAAAVLRRSGRASALTAVLPLAGLALVVGLWQYLSLPPETGPQLVWWLLPAIAVVCAVGGLVAHRRGARFAADAAALLVGVELAVWGVLRREGLTRAIIPTDAPHWLDRLTTAAAISSGVALAGLALWWLLGESPRRQPISAATAPSGSPHPAHP